MPECPECGSRNISGGTEPYGYEYHSDGQGYEWDEIFHYVCEDCECKWTETIHSERSIEIEKHGKEYHRQFLGGAHD